MNNFSPRSKVVLAEMNEPVNEQPIDETRDDVNVLDTPQDTTQEMSSTQVSHRSGRIVRPPIRFIGLGETYEVILEKAELDPYTYEEAINDIDAHHWVQAMKSELDSMYSNQVWDLVKVPNGIRSVGCIWVYKRKKGVAMLKSIIILFSIATHYDYEIWQMDVKTAFLNDNLDEEIYMMQLEGFIEKN